MPYLLLKFPGHLFIAVARCGDVLNLKGHVTPFSWCQAHEKKNNELKKKIMNQNILRKMVRSMFIERDIIANIKLKKI